MKEWKNYALAILSLVTIVLLVKGCIAGSEYENEISNLQDKLVKHELTLQVTMHKDSSRLFQMEQKAMSEHHARLLAEDDAKRFKTFSGVIKTTIKVRRDTVWVPFTDSIAILSQDSIRQVMPVSYADKWFYLGGNVKQNGLHIDSVGFKPGYVNVLIGEQRRGLFKKPLPIVELQIENPYMNITSANNVIVKEKRKRPLLLSLTAMLLYGFVLGTILLH